MTKNIPDFAPCAAWRVFRKALINNSARGFFLAGFSKISHFQVPPTRGPTRSGSDRKRHSGDNIAQDNMYTGWRPNV